MGKASSAKKVARAARAGGNRRSGQRRALGFPVAIGVVVVVGLLLVVFARDRRNADAFPRANTDHVHSSIDIYTCTADTAAATTTTTSTTATTAPVDSTSTGAPDSSSTAASDTTSTTESTTTTSAPAETATTQANPADMHGEYQPAPTDAQQDVLGIHTHGDGVMHIHPFADSAAGRKATLGIFLDQVNISLTNSQLTLPSGSTFTEGTTKCEGGKDGQLQVAKWDHVQDAASGAKPNQIFTDGFDKIRLGENESFTIAFMPAGSTIPAKSDVADRIAKVTDLGPSTTAPSSEGATSTTLPSGSTLPGTSGSGASTASDPNATTTTIAPSSSSSSGP
jgi:hypothetical protein